MKNWPTTEICTYATRAAGNSDLADALTKVFKGAQTVLTTGARHVVSMSTPSWVWGDVPAGTTFVFESAINQGFNGLQVSGRTVEGVFFTCGWDAIDARELLDQAQAR